MSSTIEGPAALHLTVIGCGSPHPAASRFGTSVVLSHGDETIMVDCGPGTTYKMLRYGLRPKDVGALLITHHHFDHTAGLPSLLLTRWESEMGPQQPIVIAGPAGTRRLIDRLVGPDGAYRPDVVARREAPLSQAKYRAFGGTPPRPDLETVVHEVGPGAKLDLLAGWRVTTARAEHVEPFHESIAFRIEIAGMAVAITGDTQLCAPVTALARGADLLIAMCGDEERRMKARGLAAGQMGTVSAATMARDAGVGAVMLTHTNTRVERSPHRERAIRQVAEIFDGEIFFSEEGLRIALPLEQD